MKKVGYVCVYGRANAGKSTIINKCLGFKLLPVSSKPQTTRDNVHAIYNDEDSQIIFVDTPGVFKPHGKLGSILLRDAESAKEGVDVILYVIDAFEAPNFELATKLKDSTIPVVVAFNKIDLIKADIGKERLARYQELLPKAKFIEVSALTGYNIPELLALLKTYLKEGNEEFPNGEVSDRPKEYIISEIIREKCMRLLSEEVPHSIYVDMKEIQEEGDGMEVYADIIVEKDSEKAIVIGKQGKMISAISKYSEDSISAYFGKKVCVNLLVKTVPDWRNSDRYLKKFGYEE
ncbi:MAG: GTPase Era [Bacilli bacterium]|jgi:GTP-binding protein Era